MKKKKNVTPEQIKNEIDIQFILHAYPISTVYRKVGLLKWGKTYLKMKKVLDGQLMNNFCIEYSLIDFKYEENVILL